MPQRRRCNRCSPRGHRVGVCLWDDHRCGAARFGPRAAQDKRGSLDMPPGTPLFAGAISRLAVQKSSFLASPIAAAS